MERPDNSLGRLPTCPTSHRLTAYATFLILALAVALRFWAIDFGFPERVRPDEQYFVHAIQRFDEAATLDPAWYYYPSFYMYLNLAVWRAWTLAQLFQGDYTPPKGLARLRDRAPNIEFLIGRIVTALFGAATVLVVWSLARRHYGRRAAVAAAFLLAVNAPHVLNSHFYKSDIATTFFTMAALLCLARYVEERRPRWNLAAAVLTGLAASTNYYGGFLLVPLAAAQFLAHGRPVAPDAGGRSIGGRIGARLIEALRAIGAGLADWTTWAMPVLALATFVLTAPHLLLQWEAFLDTFHRMLFSDRQSLYDTMVRVVDYEEYGFQGGAWVYSVRFGLRYAMGGLLALASIAGLVHLALRRRAVDWLLLIFFLVHFVMMSSGRAMFLRYYLSLIPILAIGAGALLAWAVERSVAGPRWRNAALIAGLLVLGGESLWTSVRQDRLLAREDTRVTARAWLAANLPRGAFVGTPMDWWGNYYPYGKPTLPPGSQYAAVRPEHVRGRNVRYLLIEDSPLRLYSPPERPEWREWLRRNAALVFEVSPYDPEEQWTEPVYDQLDAFYLPIARFRGIERPGPRISVYSVLEKKE